MDDIGLAAAIDRSRALVDHVRRLERERCAERLREMAREMGGNVLLMLAAERLVGK